MDVREISSDVLEDSGDRWHTPRLWISNPDAGSVKFLDNEINLLRSDEKELSIPVFWADEDREKSMDKMWLLFPGSVKFKVVDGRRRGYVGYVHIS